MSANFHGFIVPGLDVLIGDPSILSPTKTDKKRAEVFEIPESYIYRVIDFYNEQSGRGDSCRELTNRFNTILTAMHEQDTDSFELENGTLVKFVSTEGFNFSKNFDYHSSKSQAIAAAKLLTEKIDRRNLAIMTGTDQLSAIAASQHIDVARINPDVYTGRRKVILPLEYSNLWYSNKRITQDEWQNVLGNDPPLRPNEFIEFIDENDLYPQRPYPGFHNIGRFDPEEDALIPLRHIKFKNPSFSSIRPRTAGQAMLFEALLLPADKVPIVIVPGSFGTGKTFLSTAVGYYGVTESEEYERIFICPRDGALGKEVGFLPGDITDKTRAKAKPIADNVREILRLTAPSEKQKRTDEPKKAFAKRDCLDKRVDEALDKYFEYESIIYMGGRSILNSFIIYDEFQDVERYQARALLSRIGNGSKIIVSGDPTQLTNPHLNRTSNGLSYIASKLAGKPEAAIVTLSDDEVVRSSAAKAIAEYLK